MKKHPKIRIRIDDESTLHGLADITLSRGKLCLALAAALLLCLALSGLIVMLTPLRTLLPGYMKESERSASVENLLRLDSLMTVYDLNERYLDNVRKVLDTGRERPDTTGVGASLTEMSPDSLLPPSALEKRFVNTMAEREKYNISVIAPLAADGMMFATPAETAVFASSTRRSEKGTLLIGGGEGLRSIADGSVLASYYSPADNGYVVIIQHARGFVSRYSHLGAAAVSEGDVVISGQVVALPPKADARGMRRVEVMMWHNGMPLVPYEYIGQTDLRSSEETLFESPRGR